MQIINIIMMLIKQDQFKDHLLPEAFPELHVGCEYSSLLAPWSVRPLPTFTGLLEGLVRSTHLNSGSLAGQCGSHL